MGKTLKSFYEWYFRDSIQISSPTLDQWSKRLGKILTLLGFSGFWAFILIMLVTNQKGRMPRLEEWFWIVSIGIIVPWVSYRVFRMLFWLFDGRIKERIDVWSESSRKMIPILVFLILIPVTLHLWGHIILSFFSYAEFGEVVWDFFRYWDLFSIETTVP